MPQYYCENNPEFLEGFRKRLLKINRCFKHMEANVVSEPDHSERDNTHYKLMTVHFLLHNQFIFLTVTLCQGWSDFRY